MSHSVSARLQPVSQWLALDAFDERPCGRVDSVLFVPQSPYSQPMELDRIEVVRNSAPGLQARLWPGRGDCAHERQIAVLDV